MNRRVLIVTSSYAPAMTADMHRARQLAWELPKLGWEVEILSPDAAYQLRSCLDMDSAEFFAPGTITHFVSPFWPALFRTLGFGSIGWRAIIPMFWAGRKLLRQRRFDLVFLSTTQFSLFLLGPTWQRRFAVPFVLDFHDPCYKEAAHPMWARPSLKHLISGKLAKYVERRAVLRAAGIVSVSPAYIDVLRRRYADRKPIWLEPGRTAVIPFAAVPRDLEEAAQRVVPGLDRSHQPASIVYVGAGGPIMYRSFFLLCRVFAKLRIQKPRLVERVRIALYGTRLGWREGGPRDLADIASEYGVGDLVMENPNRVSYRRSLELLLGSDGALILGVDDPSYTPSKLFSYALSGKPLLASLHKNGPALAQFQNNTELGHALWFCQSNEIAMAEATSIVSAFLEEVISGRSFDRQALLEPFLTPTMARQHAKLFEACLNSG